MGQPLISIISPVYNGSEFIQKTYESILGQTYSNWEWIVVDDFSNDESAVVLKHLSMLDHRVKCIYHKTNQGASVTRNTAIAAAQGDYIAFLDIDDLWAPSKLETSLYFMESNQRDFTYTNYQKIKSGKLGLKNIETPKTISYKELLKTCAICTSTVLIRRGIIEELRMIPELRRGQDYVFWLQILQKIDCAYRASETPLTFYTIGHISLSSNKWKKAKHQWSIYRKHLNLGLLKSLYYFINYAFHGFKKYRKF